MVKLDDETFEICFQALTNDQVKGYQVNDLSQDCLLEADLACVIPYRVSLQSQNGDLGVIYEGSSIWNLLPPEDDGSPYIQDFDLKE